MKIALERRFGSKDIKDLFSESIQVDDIEFADFIWIGDKGNIEFREWKDDLPFFKFKKFLPLMIE